MNRYNIKTGDRVIINGGEPTLNKHLLSILTVIRCTGAELILYTNGRLLSNLEYCKKVIKNVHRIVIPIHGTQNVHDKITQVDGSFSETMRAISNIISTGMMRKLELKFIITKLMIDSDFCINSFLEQNSLENVNLVLTGQVPTKVSEKNNFQTADEFILGKFCSREIENLLTHHQIKLMDIKLCTLSPELINTINKMPKETEDIKYTYYYFDGLNKSGKIISYTGQRSCPHCDMLSYCKSILDECTVLQISNNRKKIVLE